MSIYAYKVKDALGNEVDLNIYQGKVLLIVNTAIHCGLAPQYKGLETLYKTYHDKGFEILDFPCNQFGNQSSESDKETYEICEVKLKNSFKPFGKVEVNGPNTDPLYVYLKKSGFQLLGRNIKWNFTKFLVNKDGKVVKRFGPLVKPEKITESIERLLVKHA
jgi:glutathione peroxidase